MRRRSASTLKAWAIFDVSKKKEETGYEGSDRSGISSVNLQMKILLRFIYRYILPKRLKNFMDIFANLRLPRIQEPSRGKLLVLSPHPDDDIFGCGGALRRAHLKGSEITAVYMTDGSRGGGSYPEEDLVRIRKDEAKRAARMIGIDELIFLGHKDTRLEYSQSSVAELKKILDRIKPDAIFLPFMLDKHPDHLATNEIFIGAAESYKGNPMCYGYEIWTPIAATNCLVDITEQLPVKIRAVEQHASQLKEVNLVSAFIGISQYRSIVSGLRNGNAEAFVACPLSEYRRLWKIFS
jgi:N-acetylglucosamine malate deacetylase 1